VSETMSPTTMPEDRRGVELAETARLETFSDGVFAIAITLLVLEIKVPPTGEHGGGNLVAALRALWPSYLGYAISFATLGIMWVNHHAMFRYIRKTNRTFLLINVFFLMAISFVPFPTAVLAEHLPDPAQRQAAAVFYGAAFVLTAAGYNAVWFYGVSGGRLLGADVDRDAVRTISNRYRWGVPTYLVTTLAALVSVWLSLALHGALAVLYMLSERGDGA
jgi:TMEM175 potassium channel family protein